MIPDDPELRRALAGRSGEPSPGLSARVQQSLAGARPPATNWIPAIAAVVVIALCSVTIGLLVLERRSPPDRPGAATSARVTTPLPTPSGKGGPTIYLPTDVVLSAPASDIVWVLVAGQLLYVSTDGGSNFDQRTLPDPNFAPTSISFADASNGMALAGGPAGTQCQGGGLHLWRTTDGARSWRLVSSVTFSPVPAGGIPFAQCKEFVSLVDAAHAFVTAWDPNSQPTIYRTADGGLTWRASKLPDPAGFTTYGAGDALRANAVQRFGDSYLVTAEGSQPSGLEEYVFLSEDGGATWSPIAKAPDAFGFAVVTPSRWLVISNDGSATETLDAGRTWHSLATDYMDAAGVASEFFFADPSVGYGTVRGSIYRSVDGGRHWARIETPGVFWPG